MDFTKDESIRMKGIAIFALMFHHCFMSRDRFAGYEIVFAPFSESFVVNICAYLKICVPIFAFITGYGLYLSYSKVDSRSGTVGWLGKRF